MQNMKTPEARRYFRRIAIASVAYAAAIALNNRYVQHADVSAAVRFGAALLPALAIIAMFVALGRYLVELRDEYVRSQLVQQMLWGTGLSLAAMTLWGFPEDAGLLPHMPAYWAAIVWFFCFGLAGCAQKVFDR